MNSVSLRATAAG
uniref:Uncharacterized protein n=1 Tax=Anguilla anguilla TaxID=7936 RepID=A0A0E9QL36_ANGAN